MNTITKIVIYVEIYQIIIRIIIIDSRNKHDLGYLILIPKLLSTTTTEKQ